MLVKYDQTFLKSPEGKDLYAKWRNIGRNGRCEEWNDFNVFCGWAMDNGYRSGMTLKRMDGRKEFGPDNCYLQKRVIASSDTWVGPEWCQKWDETVNRIRKHYGLPLFEVEL